VILTVLVSRLFYKKIKDCIYDPSETYTNSAKSQVWLDGNTFMELIPWERKYFELRKLLEVQLRKLEFENKLKRG
jgi:hypothetical protein